MILIIIEKEASNEYWLDNLDNYSVVYGSDTIWMVVWMGKYEVADCVIAMNQMIY